MYPVTALCHVTAPSEIHVTALSGFGPFRLRPLLKILSRYGPLHVTALHVTAPFTLRPFMLRPLERGYNPSQRCSSGTVSYPYKKPSAKKARPSYMAETTKVMISWKKDAPPLKSLN